jgi:hypothetical protein
MMTVTPSLVRMMQRASAGHVEVVVGDGVMVNLFANAGTAAQEDKLVATIKTTILDMAFASVH